MAEVWVIMTKVWASVKVQNDYGRGLGDYGRSWSCSAGFDKATTLFFWECRIVSGGELMKYQAENTSALSQQ